MYFWCMFTILYCCDNNNTRFILNTVSFLSDAILLHKLHKIIKMFYQNTCHFHILYAMQISLYRVTQNKWNMKFLMIQSYQCWPQIPYKTSVHISKYLKSISATLSRYWYKCIVTMQWVLIYNHFEWILV